MASGMRALERRTIERLTVLLVAVMAAACGDSPTAPAPPPPVTPPLLSAPPPPAPVPSGPARVFASAAPLSYPVSGYTLGSSYVLYDNGAFVLRFPDIGDYAGSYTGADGPLVFSFDAWNLAGPWVASGELRDRTLIVRYNMIMMLADFEDAVYTLSN